METELEKKNTLEALRKIILAAEGYTLENNGNRFIKDLGMIEDAFPLQAFPEGAIHEFISEEVEQTAASAGFISCLLGMLMQHPGPCLWISLGKRLFPPSLIQYNIDPTRIIFVQLHQQRDALWALEESLKCSSLSAVVAEIKDLDLIACRRLQLAVEKSRVTCLVHRFRPKQLHSVAFASRWRIRPAVSQNEDGLPGIGHPLWDVQLEKVRNGKPGHWQMGWLNGKFHYKGQLLTRKKHLHIKTGS